MVAPYDYKGGRIDVKDWLSWRLGGRGGFLCLFVLPLKLSGGEGDSSPSSSPFGGPGPSGVSSAPFISNVGL